MASSAPTGPTPAGEPGRPPEATVEVRLSDGATYRDVAVDERGVIVGEDVGGWDGVRPFDPPIPAERIVAIKERTGMIGYFGLFPWMRAR